MLGPNCVWMDMHSYKVIQVRCHGFETWELPLSRVGVRLHVSNSSQSQTPSCKSQAESGD